jgi:D-alanyl-D-alanine carboxypeptidase/D-alanyl-D-alanine-endopeptidase (penicillin-binding protein 4)
MNRSRILIFGLIALLISSCARHNLQKKLRDSGLSNAFTGILIQDLSSGKTVLEQNANQYFMPASNAKLLTFLLAKRILSDSVPFLRVQETKDSLFFWGTGDPTFLREGFKNRSLYDFLSKQTKVLVYADQVAWAKPLGEGWSWDDYNDYYSAEISSLPIYGNLISVNRKRKMWNIQPKLFGKDSISNTSFSYVLRNRNSNSLVLPKKPATEKLQQIPFLTSNQFTAELLSDTLHKTVLWRAKDFDPYAKLLYGNHLDSLLVSMLHESDNHIAEQLLYLIAAQKNWTGPTDKIIANLKKEDGNEFLQSIKWVDGSGLSRYNLIRPTDLIQIIRLLHQEVGLNKLTWLLPESGKSGTLKNVVLKQKNTKIWAKSGSFSNTYNLTGFYQNTHGKVFIFSILTNLANQPVSKSKKSVVEFLEKVLE